jgi:hypothetical protein
MLHTTRIHTAQVYQTVTGRWAFRYWRARACYWQTSNGHWACKASARRAAKAAGFHVVYHRFNGSLA